MMRHNTMSFLSAIDKCWITSKHLGYAYLAHGFGFVFKPVFVSKLRKLGLLRPSVDFSYSKSFEGLGNRYVTTSNYFTDLVVAFTQFKLLPEPSFIIEKDPFGRLTYMVPSVVDVGFYDKVFNPVIELVTIQMMDLFKWLKVSTNVLFHHKAMLKNISSGISGWMVWGVNRFISIASLPSASVLPVFIAFVWDRCKTTFLFHGGLLSCLDNGYCNMAGIFCQLLPRLPDEGAGGYNRAIGDMVRIPLAYPMRQAGCS